MPTAVPEPLTESLVVHWGPALEYHRQRLDLLGELKARGDLRQWYVEVHEIGARTEDVQLTLHQEGLILDARRGLLTDSSTDLLQLAFRTISPGSYHSSVLYQFVIPMVVETAERAATAALDNMSDGLYASTLGARDFALLMDGIRSGDKWQCEFGVISQQELKGRLRREVGRMRRREFGDVPFFFDDLSIDAPVAFFADLRWSLGASDAWFGADSVEALIGALDGIHANADALVSHIYSFLEGSLQRVAEGSEL